MSTKNKILLILNIFVICIGAFFLIQQFFFEDTPDMKLILKALILFLTYSFGVGRYLYLRARGYRILLSNQYLPFFTIAFQDDKKNYKQLYAVGRLINKGRYEDAYNRIEKLKKECTNKYERVAVLLAEALCLNGKMNYDAAFSVLEKALCEYPNHATAMAFRALLMQRFGMQNQALHTLNSLTSDCNYAVHFFKAVYHFNYGEHTAAVASVKDALAIDSSSVLSMLVGYKSSLALQNEEMAEYFSDSIKKLEKTMKELEQQLRVYFI